MTTLDDFTEVIKALYGDAVDPAELTKSIDVADVHVDGPLSRPRKRKRARPVEVAKNGGPAAPTGDPKKDRRVAQLGLGATGVATVGGLHAIHGTLETSKVPQVARAAHAVGDVARKAPGAAQAGKVLARVTPKNPKTAAAVATGAWLGLHGVEMAGDVLGARAQTKAIKATKKAVPVSGSVDKALRLSLKPVNPQVIRRVPTLKARRAPGSPALAKSFDADVEISKVAPDRQQVFGWANVSKVNGQTVRDRQGDEIDIDELEKAAYDYVLDSRIGGDQHARVSKSFDGTPKHTSDVIESMVFTPEKIEKMGLPPDFPQGWWIGMQVNDPETWELIKSGKRSGFSVHGTGRRVPLEKADRRALDHDLGERTRQAVHPPPVKRAPVESSWIDSMGYQQQTRKLSIQTKEGRTYDSRVPKKVARQVIGAKSPGTAYNREIKAKHAPRHTRYTVGDRARLFVKPDVSKAAAPIPVGAPNPTPRSRSTKRAKRVEDGAQIVAGTAGAGFGAAKFRDTHREQYPVKHTAGVKRAVKVVRTHGGTPQQAAKVAHVLHGAKPGFKTLATVVAAGTVATGAHRYQEIEHYLKQKRASVEKAQFARTPITQVARAATNVGVKPKHVARPYVGRRRKAGLADKLKAQALIHSNKIYEVGDAIAGSLQ